jgi:hypothetical protein
LHRQSCGPTTNAENPEENEDFSSGAVNRAVSEKFEDAFPADLQAIVVAWQNLSPEVKAVILALVRSADGKPIKE